MVYFLTFLAGGFIGCSATILLLLSMASSKYNNNEMTVSSNVEGIKQHEK